MENKYPIRQNGYIYSAGTAKGFLRMQRQGIPRPVFSVEQRLRKLLNKLYGKILRKALLEFQTAAKTNGLVISRKDLTHDDAGTNNEDENLVNILNFFDEMEKQDQEAKKAQEKAIQRANVGNTAQSLKSQWEAEESGIPFDDDVKTQIDKILEDNLDNYEERLLSDASDMMKIIVNSFSLDKRKLYEENLEGIRRLYLDNALERMKGEEVWLKRALINKLNDYATGKTDKLDIKNIVTGLYYSSEHMARFFARDQLARFNKATTLTMYENAGVKKVKWVTTHDIRVRASHKKLDGQVFNIHALPQEIDDYNCRCGLVPVEWDN